MGSFRYHLAAAAARLAGHRKIFSMNAEAMRVFLQKEQTRRDPSPPRWIRHKYPLRTIPVLGRPLYVISPAAQTAKEQPSKGAGQTALFFIHGGGFIMEAHPVHWLAAARIIDTLGITVWFPAYPLITGNPALDAARGSFVEHACEMIRASWALTRESHPGSPVVFLGDSAGTSLALSACHRNKALGQPLPHRLILVSPAMITERDPAILAEMRRIESKDVLLSMNLMDSLTRLLDMDTSRDNYYNAPLYGDFSGFPPLDIFAGDRDICYPLALPFAERVREAGVPVNFHHGGGMMHVWPYMPLAPECTAALEAIIGIIGDTG
jgi:acetyl esterase/lipase